MSVHADAPTSVLPTFSLLFFALITFLITWGIIGVYLYFPEQASGTVGEISGSDTLYFFTTWAPAISALVLVLVFGGLTGLRAFLSRLLLWRGAPGW